MDRAITYIRDILAPGQASPRRVLRADHNETTATSQRGLEPNTKPTRKEGLRGRPETTAATGKPWIWVKSLSGLAWRWLVAVVSLWPLSILLGMTWPGANLSLRGNFGPHRQTNQIRDTNQEETTATRQPGKKPHATPPHNEGY